MSSGRWKMSEQVNFTCNKLKFRYTENKRISVYFTVEYENRKYFPHAYQQKI